MSIFGIGFGLGLARSMEIRRGVPGESTGFGRGKNLKQEFSAVLQDFSKA